LIGPFVRDVSVPAWQRLTLRLMLTRPWGPRAWAAWFRRIHRSMSDGLDQRVATVRRMVAEPGRLEAVRAMAMSGCAEVDAVLDHITAPTLVVMGAEDPDFPDPAAEAAAIAERVGGTVMLVPDAGHYPHLEKPQAVVDRIVAHVHATTCHRAG
jgi:pimeloyl-ACP methyl ester carboxylesterase